MSLTNITRVLGSRNGALPTVRGKIADGSRQNKSSHSNFYEFRLSSTLVSFPVTPKPSARELLAFRKFRPTKARGPSQPNFTNWRQKMNKINAAIPKVLHYTCWVARRTGFGADAGNREEQPVVSKTRFVRIERWSPPRIGCEPELQLRAAVAP